jgi:hypothetical protein
MTELERMLLKSVERLIVQFEQQSGDSQSNLRALQKQFDALIEAERLMTTRRIDDLSLSLAQLDSIITAQQTKLLESLLSAQSAWQSEQGRRLDALEALSKSLVMQLDRLSEEFTQ